MNDRSRSSYEEDDDDAEKGGKMGNVFPCGGGGGGGEGTAAGGGEFTHLDRGPTNCGMLTGHIEMLRHYNGRISQHRDRRFI